MTTDIDLFDDGTVLFSAEREVWSVNGKHRFQSRMVTETSLNGSVHLRLATEIEDTLLDRLAAMCKGGWCNGAPGDYHTFVPVE